MIKPRTKAIDLLVPDKSMWVTIYPHIYHPKGINLIEWQHVIEHEKVHLTRQRRMGVKKWLLRYVLDADFRGAEEIRGVYAEVQAMTDIMETNATLLRYFEALSSGYRPLPWSRSPFASPKDAADAYYAYAKLVQ